jgi:hypothetical protein
MEFEKKNISWIKIMQVASEASGFAVMVFVE